MTGSNFNRRWRQIIQQVAILDCTTSCAEDCERSQQCLFWPTVHHHTTIFSTTTLHLVHNFVLALSTFVQYILHHSSVAAPSPSLSTTASALSACPCPCPSASASALSTSMLSISVASPSPSSSSSIGNCVSSGTTVVDDATVASNPPSCSPPHTLLHPFLCLQSHTLVTLKEYYKYAFQSKQPTALQDSDSYPTLPTTTHDGSPNLPVPVKRRFLFRKNPIDITTLQDSLPLRLKCSDCKRKPEGPLDRNTSRFCMECSLVCYAATSKMYAVCNHCFRSGFHEKQAILRHRSVTQLVEFYFKKVGNFTPHPASACSILNLHTEALPALKNIASSPPLLKPSYAKSKLRDGCSVHTAVQSLPNPTSTSLPSIGNSIFLPDDDEPLSNARWSSSLWSHKRD
uniref:Fc receptor-like B n=1 Tax=Lygus hesperus TaxID=30085 RepID=A0A0A9XVP1_LYGHE